MISETERSMLCSLAKRYFTTVNGLVRLREQGISYRRVEEILAVRAAIVKDLDPRRAHTHTPPLTDIATFYSYFADNQTPEHVVQMMYSMQAAFGGSNLRQDINQAITVAITTQTYNLETIIRTAKLTPGHSKVRDIIFQLYSA